MTEECNCESKDHYHPKIRLIQFMDDTERILSKKCEPVTEMTKEIDELIEDMRATMHAFNGLAIAAPQIGKSLQIIVINKAIYDKEEEDLVIINPEIVSLSGDKKLDMEFCLSFPIGKYKERYEEVEIKCKNRKMENAIIFEDTPMKSKVLQHEIDHLNGITLLDD